MHLFHQNKVDNVSTSQLVSFSYTLVSKSSLYRLVSEVLMILEIVWNLEGLSSSLMCMCHVCQDTKGRYVIFFSEQSSIITVLVVHTEK